MPSPGDQSPGEVLVLLDDPDGGVIERSVTRSGLRVLTEESRVGRSVTVGVVVPVGSRDEGEGAHGASHFLEHLLFKGTARRTALEISAAIEAVGGDLNAFTGKEYTCFYARVLDRDVALAVDVLLDMVNSATLASSEIESERGVVLEEIAMHEDDPAGVAQELFGGQVFATSALALPVIGSQTGIAEMTEAAIREHYRHWYAVDHLSLVAAGHVRHGEVVAAAEAALGRAAELRRAEPLPRRGSAGAESASPTRPASTARVRPTEQVNLVVGSAAVSRMDPRRFALAVYNAAIGGGMSSRLFQEVREERGLAYSVQSFTSMYSDAGAFGVYAGTSPTRSAETLEVIQDVLRTVERTGFDAQELERGKGQLRGALVLGREESSNRMVALAESEVITGRLAGLSESLAHIDAVTSDDVAAVAEYLAASPSSVALVGPESMGGSQ
ncbi:MAG: insulinase family protein [Actinobacteria bacterium]|nr:insulinase family protein [Actinomycetota bacterium]